MSPSRVKSNGRVEWVIHLDHAIAYPPYKSEGYLSKRSRTILSYTERIKELNRVYNDGVTQL
jgi:hypothetical protein